MEMTTLSFNEEELMRLEAIFMDKEWIKIRRRPYGFCWR
jgi:hypothetical protein